jgi:hypothetical protein
VWSIGRILAGAAPQPAVKLTEPFVLRNSRDFSCADVMFSFARMENFERPRDQILEVWHIVVSEVFVNDLHRYLSTT